MTPDRTTDPSLIRSSWDDAGWGDGTGAENGPVSDAHAPDVPTPPVEAHDAQACRDIAAAATRERDRHHTELAAARAGEASAIEAHDILEGRLRDSMADADRLLEQRDSAHDAMNVWMARAEAAEAKVERVEAELRTSAEHSHVIGDDGDCLYDGIPADECIVQIALAALAGGGA